MASSGPQGTVISSGCFAGRVLDFEQCTYVAMSFKSSRALVLAMCMINNL